MFASVDSFSQGIGWRPAGLSTISSSSAFTIPGSDTPLQYAAISFVAPESSPLLKVQLYFTTSVGAPSINLSLYTDVAGKPNTAGPVTGAVSSNVTITPNAWNEFVFDPSTTALTKGQRYWVAVKNVAAGTTVYWHYSANGVGCYGLGTNTSWGYVTASTSNGDANWAAQYGGSGAHLFTLSSGKRFGSPLVGNTMTSTMFSMLVGNVVTIPQGLNFMCSGFQTFILRGVAATTDLTGVIVGRGTSLVIPKTAVNTNGDNYGFIFEKPILLRGGDRVRVVVSTSGDGSNYYRLPIWTANPTCYDMIPLNMMQTVSLNGGATWSDTPGSFYAMILLGTIGKEYPAASSNRRRYHSMR